jgi:hypothetical protein
VFGKSFLALAQLPLPLTSWLSPVAAVAVPAAVAVVVLADTELRLELREAGQVLSLL